MDILNYSPESGLFTWKKARNNRIKIGQIAGNKVLTSGKTYIQIMIKKKNYLAHRLAWLYFHEEIPLHEIDHINGDSSDNRIENLRAVNRAENAKNKRLNSNSSSGVCGVCYDKSREKWIAHIQVNRKTIWLGRYDKKDEAITARSLADIKYGFHENHGTVRPL